MLASEVHHGKFSVTVLDICYQTSFLALADYCYVALVPISTVFLYSKLDLKTLMERDRGGFKFTDGTITVFG